MDWVERRFMNESDDRMWRDGGASVPRVGSRGSFTGATASGAVIGLRKGGRPDCLGSRDELFRPCGGHRSGSGAGHGLRGTAPIDALLYPFGESDARMRRGLQGI